MNFLKIFITPSFYTIAEKILQTLVCFIFYLFDCYCSPVIILSIKNKIKGKLVFEVFHRKKRKKRSNTFVCKFLN